MKKTVLLFLSVALSVLLLTACGQKTNAIATKTEKENPTEKSTETPEAPETDEKPTETTETTETDGKTREDDGKEMYVYIGENRLKVDLANNSSRRTRSSDSCERGTFRIRQATTAISKRSGISDIPYRETIRR